MPKVNYQVRQSPFELQSAYKILLDKWGHQNWWPGDSQLEIIVGALLAQVTNWKNAALAVANLKTKGFLDDSIQSFQNLLELDDAELEKLIRPSGYFRQKSRRLKRLIKFLSAKLALPPWKIPVSDMEAWRKELLNIKGLGPETVDSILLYGFNLPVFVVDAYTRRILFRHRIIDEKATYEEIRKLFENNLPKRSSIYNEYHALIVRLGKEHCRTAPYCCGCPLAG